MEKPIGSDFPGEINRMIWEERGTFTSHILGNIFPVYTSSNTANLPKHENHL